MSMLRPLGETSPSVAYMLLPMEDVGTLVREARHRSGLSARQLAELAQVPASTVSRVERGEMNPTVAMLSRLIEAAGSDLVIELGDGTLQQPTLTALRARADAIRDTVTRHGGSNIRVVGSVGRGDSGSGSDVDLLIDVQPGTGLIALAKLEDELSDSLPWKVDVLTSGMARGRMAHILDDAVPL